MSAVSLTAMPSHVTLFLVVRYFWPCLFLIYRVPVDDAFQDSPVAYINMIFPLFHYAPPSPLPSLYPWCAAYTRHMHRVADNCEFRLHSVAFNI